jgi:hypothetical protein
MSYKVDYSDAEKQGCSSKVTIENRIFYVKLFESATEPARYYAGDQKGTILKEISKKEFDFWLKTLADKELEIEDIKTKINSGKKYPRRA